MSLKINSQWSSSLPYIDMMLENPETRKRLSTALDTFQVNRKKFTQIQDLFKAAVTKLIDMNLRIEEKERDMADSRVKNKQKVQADKKAIESEIEEFLKEERKSIQIYDWNSHKFIYCKTSQQFAAALKQGIHSQSIASVITGAGRNYYSKADRDHFIQEIDNLARNLFSKDLSLQADFKASLLIKVLRITDPNKVSEFIVNGVKKEAAAFEEMRKFIKGLQDELIRRNEPETQNNKLLDKPSTLKKRKDNFFKKNGVPPIFTNSPLSSPDSSPSQTSRFNFDVTEDDMVFTNNREEQVLSTQNPPFILPKHLAPHIQKLRKNFESEESKPDLKLKQTSIGQQNQKIPASEKIETPIIKREELVLRPSSNEIKSQDIFLVRWFNAAKHSLVICKNWLLNGLKSIKNLFLSH